MVDKDIEVLNRMLMGILGSSKLVHAWWQSENKAFDMKTPIEMFIDDKDKVINYIYTQFK